MQVGRRRVLQLVAQTGGLLAGLNAGLWRGPARAATVTRLSLRAVGSEDAAALQTMMTACVSDADAFFGKCGDWSLSWAQNLIARCPETVLLTDESGPVAFLELPNIRPQAPALRSGASAEEREQHRTRERDRTTFRVTAAGLRDDLLSPEQSVRIFRKLLYHSFVRARQQGYETVEAIAPWERHPRMARKWTDYPGCELFEPVSRSQGDGKDLYWLRWRLDDAVTALAAEGANEDQLDAMP